MEGGGFIVVSPCMLVEKGGKDGGRRVYSFDIETPFVCVIVGRISSGLGACWSGYQ